LKPYKLTYKQFGDSGILIEWPQEISKDLLHDIRDFYESIKARNYPEVVEVNFVYASMLVIYHPEDINYRELKLRLQDDYTDRNVKLQGFNKNIWEIPVCYHPEFGLDLNELALSKNMSVDQICRLHSTNLYTVFGIGFLPGFLYLGGMAKELIQARKIKPRMLVPKGAVAIGGNQTGIYPQNSPGGWHIIGRTPIHMFDLNRGYPCEIKPGDEVRFQAISKRAYKNLESEQEAGNYSLKPITT
jgi:inhibitor of KinA